MQGNRHHSDLGINGIVGIAQVVSVAPCRTLRNAILCHGPSSRLGVKKLVAFINHKTNIEAIGHRK